MPQIPQFISDKLVKRASEGLLRTLSVPQADWIDFSSNDYLGLSRDGRFAQSVEEKLRELGERQQIGSTGSRLISGNSAYAEELEKKLAAFHRAEAGLIFNSGYDANCGMLACLAQKGDTYISDELIHASLIDGMRLSYANRLRFKHNDLADLELKLKRASGNIFVLTESVYSMDGHCAPLKEITQLCKQYGAHLIVDEAHGIGVFHSEGGGKVMELGLQNDCFARIYTFGKAPGCHGALVVGSKELRSYLINFCRSFIYTTALPLHSLASIEVSYQLMRNAQSERENLQELIAFFQQEIEQIESVELIPSPSPIQGIVIAGNEQVSQVAMSLQNEGIWAKAIRSPTVPAGRERIRICLHTYNTKEEVLKLKNSLLKGIH